MTIAMVGSGDVSLEPGACFAEFGRSVIWVDRDADKIAALNSDATPIYQPSLHDLISDNARLERLSFRTHSSEAVAQAEAVGTPSRRGAGSADPSCVCGRPGDIAREFDGYTVVMTQSTPSFGAGDEADKVIRHVAPHADVAIVYNRQRPHEGAAISDVERQE